MALGISEPSHIPIHLESLGKKPYWGETERRIAARLREAAAESFLERCGVCTECLPCPERIDIPELMRLFHLARTFDMGLFARYRYGQMKPNDHWVPGAKATACTGCGECLPRCPQMLDIPALLRKAHDIMQESGTR